MQGQRPCRVRAEPEKEIPGDIIPPGIFLLLDETSRTFYRLYQQRRWSHAAQAGLFAGVTLVLLLTLTLTDGTIREVGAYNPFLIIDGRGWRTAYEPCEALNAFGNRLNP